MIVLDDECEFAGLDPKVVSSIARRLERAAREAHAIGLTVFGGSGSGSLRWQNERGLGARGNIVVAEINGGAWDGGDGSTHRDENGLLRGEDA